MAKEVVLVSQALGFEKEDVVGKKHRESVSLVLAYVNGEKKKLLESVLEALESASRVLVMYCQGLVVTKD